DVDARVASTPMQAVGLRLAAPVGENCGAEPLQSRFQTGIRDLRDALRQRGSLGRGQRPLRTDRGSPLRQWSLHEGESRNGAVAEEAIDTLEDLRLAVLDRERCAGTDAQLQHAVAAAALGKP